MSRHARADPERRARGEFVVAAWIAAAVTVLLAVCVQFGRTGLVAGLGAVQATLVLAWVVGTALPGRIGGLLIGTAAAGGADAVLVVRQPATLAAVLGVLALCFPVLLVHQLSRGVVRVRVTESLSGVAVLCTAGTALAAHLALLRVVDGRRLVSAVVIATGLALIAGLLVDAVLPAPRFAQDVPHGLLGLGAAIAVGTLAGAGHALGSGRIDLAGGAILGAVVAAAAALVAVGVGYVAQTVEPLQVPLAGVALPYLRVALPFALIAPVGYLLGLYVTG